MSINIDNLLDSKHVTVSTRDTYKATATVGKDKIEAEYFVFDNSDWWQTKKMNVFEKVWDVITTPFWKAKHWIRNAYWEIRYGFQRMFKGYDSVDTFETFYKFIERYTKILTEYRKKHWGIPMEFENSAEEWDKIVDEMLYHLHYMDEETVTDELEKDVPDDWTVSSKSVYEVMNKHKDAFFELFSKYFYDLWD
jgi:hypothetical protein